MIITYYQKVSCTILEYHTPITYYNDGALDWGEESSQYCSEVTTRLNYIGVQIEVTEPALFKPKKLKDDLQDKISDIKYTEKTSVEGFSAVKLRTILISLRA